LFGGVRLTLILSHPRGIMYQVATYKSKRLARRFYWDEKLV
jgi:hypothetical protein